MVLTAVDFQEKVRPLLLANLMLVAADPLVNVVAIADMLVARLFVEVSVMIEARNKSSPPHMTVDPRINGSRESTGASSSDGRKQGPLPKLETMNNPLQRPANSPAIFDREAQPSGLKSIDSPLGRITDTDRRFVSHPRKTTIETPALFREMKQEKLERSLIRMPRDQSTRGFTHIGAVPTQKNPPEKQPSRSNTHSREALLSREYSLAIKIGLPSVRHSSPANKEMSVLTFAQKKTVDQPASRSDVSKPRGETTQTLSILPSSRHRSRSFSEEVGLLGPSHFGSSPEARSEEKELQRKAATDKQQLPDARMATKNPILAVVEKPGLHSSTGEKKKKLQMRPNHHGNFPNLLELLTSVEHDMKSCDESFLPTLPVRK